MNPHPPFTALVLGGGGSTGNAWLIGVVAGLHDAGLDVTDADLVVGTSAGSTAAAQITGDPTPRALLADILDAPPRASTPATGSERPSRTARAVTDHLARMRALIDASADAADLRRRLGAAALERAAADDSFAPRWRATVAARLPRLQWPARRVLITAVDAGSGEPAVFDRHSGVELVDAVAASCSSGAAYPIGDRAYIDGGFRSNAENADLAAGAARVLVLAPFGGRSLVPEAWGTHLATQIEALRAGGSEVETIVPGADEEHLFGPNAMDVSLRPEAALAGFAVGRERAARLAALWR
jgi:NTE family protein